MGHPGRRTRTLLLSEESERGNTDWTPPAERAAADCFIKFQRLGGGGQRERSPAQSCRFETTYEYGSLEACRDSDSKHAWRRCCRSVVPLYQAASRMRSSETGGVGPTPAAPSGRRPPTPTPTPSFCCCLATEMDESPARKCHGAPRQLT